MTCGTCKHEAVRGEFPCTGCNHGRWWEPKAEQPAEVEPYGWHWQEVHEATGAVVNDGFTLNAPGVVPPPPRMRSKLRGFVQIGIPLYRKPA